MRDTDLTFLYRGGRLMEIDIHFAALIERLDGRGDPCVVLAAALVSHAAAAGHVCLDLMALDGAQWPALPDGGPVVRCPPAGEWTNRLRASTVVGDPGERRPLILDHNGRLYLHRYWTYEQTVLAAIRRRTGAGGATALNRAPSSLRRAFRRLFPGGGGAAEIDWQQIAALAVLCARFCVISGGPGTGKTFTVARILALLVEQAQGAAPDIMLAAPTGKAAAKLGDALAAAKRTLDCRPAVLARIPVEVRTIHRMLHPNTERSGFRYNAENRLPADVVIVDEASMVDLALLAKLTAALNDRARLVLIGDMDQLASIEAGAVLGDICDRGRPHRFSPDFCRVAKQATGITLKPFGAAEAATGGPRDSVVTLAKNFRFDGQSGIGALSRAVKRGDGAATVQLLENSRDDSIRWNPIASARELHRRLPGHIVAGYRDGLTSDDPRRALAALNRFRLLCAVNRGPWGVAAINRLAEQALHRAHLIAIPDGRGANWYAGRPVLVTANDYRLGLFNGDNGLTVAAADAEKRLSVCFPGADTAVRRFGPQELTAIETVFAMTVHKSQGSEFDRVHLILPDIDSPLLTRELIYTAVTRARSKVTIWGSRPMLTAAIARRIERRSGLRDALWGEGAGD